MNEETKAKIWDLLDMVRTKQLPVNVAVDKIVLMMEEASVPDLPAMWTEDISKYICSPTESMNQAFRNGWTTETIWDELQLFLDREYPKQDVDHDQIRRHFFNYIRKRKPEKENNLESWIDE